MLKPFKGRKKNDIPSCTISAITRQAIELERCSNPPKDAERLPVSILEKVGKFWILIFYGLRHNGEGWGLFGPLDLALSPNRLMEPLRFFF